MTIQVYPAAKSQVTSNFWRYTAVGGETTLTGVDNAGVTLYYYPNQEQVFLNGVLLVRGVDYTATSGTSITGLAALVAGDTVQVNCYSNFTITQVPVTALQGSITNLQLANSSVTIGGQTINLGGSQSTFSGITLTAPTINNQIAGTQYSTSVPLTVKGAAGQAVSLQEWQNSSNSVLTKIDSSGNINTSGSITIGNNNGSGTAYRINLAGSDTNHSIYSTGSNSNNMYFNEYGSFNFYNTQYSKNVANIDQYGNLSTNGTIVVNGGRSITGSTTTPGGVYLDSTGNNVDIVTYNRAASITGGWASLRIHQQAGIDGFAIVGDTSQTSNFMRIENSAGTQLMNFTSGGALNTYTPGNTDKIALSLNSDGPTSDGKTAIQILKSAGGSGYGGEVAGYLTQSVGSGLRFSIVAGGTATEGARLISNGMSFLIGYTTTNSTSYKLQVNSQIFATSASIATSDGRFKENVSTINNGLQLVDALNPVSFSWKKHNKHNFVEGKTVGFIAQEVREALKDCEWVDNIVKENKDGETGEEFLGLVESHIIPLLVSAVKELSAKVKKLEAKNV